jgi:ferredoxin
MSMIVKVDREKCAGHARCWTLAPDIFQLDDEGYVLPEDIKVPEGQEQLAGRAVRACPERALRIAED